MSKDIQYSIVETIELEINQFNSGQIITIYENTGNQNTMPGTTTLTVNSFVKNLKAFSKISSLPGIRMPNFLLEDSETDKTYKMLDVLWNNPRKQLNLFISKTGSTWKEVGAVSVLNPSGYPYKSYNLQDYYTSNLAIELGRNGKLGVQVQDVGYGGLTGDDKIVIHGSYVEEIVAYESQILLQPTNFTKSVTTVSSTVLTANEERGYILIVNSGSVPVYLALGSPAMVGQGILLSGYGSSYELISLETGIYRGEITAISTETTSIQGVECSI